MRHRFVGMHTVEDWGHTLPWFSAQHSASQWVLPDSQGLLDSTGQLSPSSSVLKNRTVWIIIINLFCKNRWWHCEYDKTPKNNPKKKANGDCNHRVPETVELCLKEKPWSRPEPKAMLQLLGRLEMKLIAFKRLICREPRSPEWVKSWVDVYFSMGMAMLRTSRPIDSWEIGKVVTQAQEKWQSFPLGIRVWVLMDYWSVCSRIGNCSFFFPDVAVCICSLQRPPTD